MLLFANAHCARKHAFRCSLLQYRCKQKTDRIVQHKDCNSPISVNLKFDSCKWRNGEVLQNK